MKNFLLVSLSFLSLHPLWNSIAMDQPTQNSYEQKHQFDRRMICCNNQKIREYQSNTIFVKAVNDPNLDNIKASWLKFGHQSVVQIAAAKDCPKKNITCAGVSFDAYDISDRHYEFQIHTTAITMEKAVMLRHYILSQREQGDQRVPIPHLNFDLCPLISTSVIDPNTGGYTENNDNVGKELQIHLILKVDPRAINHTGPCDIHSPAKRSITAYLNNISGRETMANYLTNHLSTIRSPQQLIIDTHMHRPAVYRFNEVVVCGNNYTRFFNNSQDIEILGIGISSYWLENRLFPNPSDISALKELGKVIPIVYYDPDTNLTLSESMIFGYCPPVHWHSRLKTMFAHKKYLTSIEGLLDLPAMIKGISLEAFFLYIDSTKYNEFSNEYEIFKDKYNNLIDYVSDDSLEFNPQMIIPHVKEVTLLNYKLFIKFYDMLLLIPNLSDQNRHCIIKQRIKNTRLLNVLLRGSTLPS